MAPAQGNVERLRTELRDLDAQRKAMEEEIALLSERLNAPGQPGSKDSLLDKEGFPRDDIDVLQVRRDRHRIICLTNDQKVLTDRLGVLLADLHAATRAQASNGAAAAAASMDTTGNGAGTAPPSAAAAATTTAAGAASVSAAAPMEVDGTAAGPLGAAPRGGAEASASGPADSRSLAAVEGGGGEAGASAGPPLVPFALVDEVTAGAPAALAGVQVGDLLCAFGDVTAATGGSSGDSGALLQRVAGVLAGSEGRPVATRVLRQGAPLELTLVPQRWAGRGLLGCHLRPL